MANTLAEVSDTRDAGVRKTIGFIHRRAQARTNRAIAKDLDIEETTLSRWRDDHLDRAVRYLHACGLKVVANDWICLEPREKDALDFYAEIGMAAKRAERKTVLDWDE